jgi:hypothetical protein
MVWLVHTLLVQTREIYWASETSEITVVQRNDKPKYVDANNKNIGKECRCEFAEENNLLK